MTRNPTGDRARHRAGAGALAALLLVAAACGSSSKKDAATTAGGSATTAAGATTAAATTVAAKATPPSGTVKLAYPVGPAGLNPHTQTLVIDPIATFLVYDRLVKIDPKSFEILPMLATKWEFGTGTLTLTLRSDVKFHDGTPFDAAAVKANIEDGQNGAKSTVKPLLAAITATEVVNPTTVKFTLAAGHGAEVMANLASNAGTMISPKALADTTLDLSKQPGNSGSGAYLITEYDPTTHVTLKHADDTYWDPAGGKLASIVINIIAKTQGRLDAVATGEDDVAHLQLPEAQDALTKAASGGYSVYKIDNFLSAHDTIFNASDPRLADVRVRQALAYAVDRDGIANGLLNKGCTVSNQLYPQTHWAYSPNLTDYAYNVAKAKDLLAQAGVTNLKLEVGYGAGTPFELVATAIKDQWKQIGVDLTLKPYSTSATAQAGFLAGEVPILQGALVGVPEPDTLIRQYYLGGYNLIKDSATKAKVEADAVAAVDPKLDTKGRAAAYEKVFKTIADQVWNIRICRTFQTYAFNPKVQGVDTMGLVYSGFMDASRLSLKA